MSNSQVDMTVQTVLNTIYSGSFTKILPNTGLYKQLEYIGSSGDKSWNKLTTELLKHKIDMVYDRYNHTFKIFR